MDKLPKDYKAVNKRTYDKICRSWEEKRDYVWEPTKRFLQENSGRAKTLLDIGCGNGRHMQLAARLGYKKIIGCDFSEAQLKICQEKGFTTKNCDMTDLDFKDSSFDIVLCIASLHHLMTEKEQLKALSEVKRVLNNRGKAQISVWIPQPGYLKKQIEKKKFNFLDDHEDKKIAKVTYTILNKKKSYLRYYYMFSEQEFKKLCLESGFRIITSQKLKGNFYLILQKI